MTCHSFTLIVEGPDLQADEHLNALYEAGCDDALVRRTAGVQYLDFSREASSLEAALISAVAAIESAVPGARVGRVADEGLVSMADIARRAGRTRESIRLLVAGERGPGGFPPPATDPCSRYRLWRWSEVEQWFATRLGEPLEEQGEVIESAVNALLAWRKASASLSPGQRRALRKLAAS